MKKILIPFFLVFTMLLSVSCNNLQNGAYEDDLSADSSETESGSKVTEQSNIKEETSNETEDEKSDVTTESNTEIKIESEALKMVDFIVRVPEGREPKILHITDPQIIDASQMRTPDRLGGVLSNYWGADKKNERCYDFLKEIITETDPDLIILTGDIIYGEFDDNGSNLIEFVEFMEGFNIPWAPVFGNHDNESKMGADWQSKQFENAENCLFLQRKMTGNGNYTVGIEQGGELVRVFFMLDSNGISNASDESMSNNHTQREIGFGRDQIKWYTKNAKAIKNESPNTKFSFAFHIQLNVFGEAIARYTTDPNKHVFIDYSENRQEGDFGYIEKHYSGFDVDKSIFEGLKNLGVDSIFVGHEHSNSASIVYEGVRLQFGMKCSSYDSINYVSDSGEIEFTAYSTATPWIGGTVFELDSEGNIVDPYIYYCKKGGADIDWDNIYKQAENPKYDDVFDVVDFVVKVPEDRKLCVI